MTLDIIKKMKNLIFCRCNNKIKPIKITDISSKDLILIRI